jgi:hypothetical protein
MCLRVRIWELYLPAGCGFTLSFPDAKVPDFICAKTFAGDVLLGADGGRGGTGGTGGALKGDCEYMFRLGGSMHKISKRNQIPLNVRYSLVCAGVNWGKPV